MSAGPEMQPLPLSTPLPAGMQGLLLRQDAPRPQLRPHVHRILLEMLARHLKLPASDLELLFTASGKPFCPQAEAAGLGFSFSYAPPHVCIVTGPYRSMGVDIEPIVADEPTWHLLELVFSPRELEQWLRLPAGEVRRRAFTAAWTFKEAVLKARGTGLADSPQSIHVTFAADGSVRPGSGDTRPSWQSLDGIPGCAGTLVWFE